MLGQALGHTALTALSTVILHRRNEYYAELEASNKANEVTRWLAWFAGVVLEAQLRGQSLVEFVLETTRLLDRVRGMVNERQEKALLRMMREGPSGFEGGLSAANYRSITGATTATTTRDLADLVDKGALVRTGERRHARYQLAVALRETPRVTVGESGEVVVAS